MPRGLDLSEAECLSLSAQLHGAFFCFPTKLAGTNGRTDHALRAPPVWCHLSSQGCTSRLNRLALLALRCGIQMLRTAGCGCRPDFPASNDRFLWKAKSAPPRSIPRPGRAADVAAPASGRLIRKAIIRPYFGERPLSTLVRSISALMLTRQPAAGVTPLRVRPLWSWQLGILGSRSFSEAQNPNAKCRPCCIPTNRWVAMHCNAAKYRSKTPDQGSCALKLATWHGVLSNEPKAA